MIELSDKEFNLLADFIKANYGIYLKDDKKPLLAARLHTVLAESNFKSFTDYYHHLISDSSGGAATTLVNRITTNHTYFMREPGHFYFLKNTVLPYLAKHVQGKDIRIWCAGCATGEESYTIAMLLDEFFEKEKFFWDTKILATDISERALNHAITGRYHNEALSALPAQWRLKYFKRIDEEYSEIIDRIKHEVLYRRLNLVDEVFPFKKKLQVIFCRNVMIYFDNDTKNELVNKFYDCLEDGGYLFIGHSETINRDKSQFKYVMPSVYRKEKSSCRAT